MADEQDGRNTEHVQIVAAFPEKWDGVPGAEIEAAVPGVSQSTVSRWRSGKWKTLTASTRSAMEENLREEPPSALEVAIGKRLRTARKAAGLTQAAAAMRLGIEQSSVSRWEKGRNVPGAVRLVDICGLYNASIQYLVIGPDARSPAELQIAKIREILSGTTEADAKESEAQDRNRRLAEDAERASRAIPPQSKAKG